MSDSYLFEAGWIFLAAWGVVVAAVSMAAFGRDLLPTQSRLEVATEEQSPDSRQPS